jgi:hypothetical protein
MGHKPAKALPHPDDIIIEADGSVKIVGPVIEQDQIILETILKARDQWIEIGTIAARAEGRVMDQNFALALWKQARRKFYRFNANIPPLLKKPFPRFEP